MKSRPDQSFQGRFYVTPNQDCGRPCLREIEFQFDEPTRPPKKRPSVLSVFSIEVLTLRVACSTRLNDKLCATWNALQRSYGRDWNATSRELTLTVEHVCSDLGFSCAVDKGCLPNNVVIGDELPQFTSSSRAHATCAQPPATPGECSNLPSAPASHRQRHAPRFLPRGLSNTRCSTQHRHVIRADVEQPLTGLAINTCQIQNSIPRQSIVCSHPRMPTPSTQPPGLGPLRNAA